MHEANKVQKKSVCEEDLDQIFTKTSRFILKQLDYSLSIFIARWKSRAHNLIASGVAGGRFFAFSKCL